MEGIVGLSFLFDWIGRFTRLLGFKICGPTHQLEQPTMSKESDSGPQEPPPEVVNQVIDQELLVENAVAKSFWPRWSQVSMAKLVDAEKRLLSKVPAFIQSQFIKVRYYNSSINTITAKKD
ncbi:hypothetical protein M3Y98_00512800 [Aphelenchoides besseyi]|nr:hypothetical protein M3Y98_00512800 [Aphelenchoides besseyi]